MARKTGRHDGRERQYRILMSRMQSGLTGPPGSTLVVGGPGFGKSTFFEDLARPELRQKVLGTIADRLDFCPVRVPTGGRLDERNLLAMMRRALEGEVVGETDESCTEAELEEALQTRIASRGRAHVFLIDDFHAVSRSEDFSPPFFSFLRYLGYSVRAGYVLTSQLDIADMAVRQEVQASPFWNIFSKIRLGPLGPDGALDALSQALGRIGGVRDEHLRALAPIAGGLPFLIGALAEAVEKAAAGNGESWSSRYVFDETLARSAPVLDAVWGAVRPAGRTALGLLLEQAGTLSPGVRDGLLPLAENGYLDRETFAPRSPVLSWDWTRRLGRDPEPVAQGLAELPPRRKGAFSRLFGR